MNKGAIFIDNTTASAEVARELAEKADARGFGFLDAPVSGGQAGAENGVLTVMVGGEQPAFDKAKPVIESFARMVGLMGPAGAGQLTKMINQICIAGLVQGLAEGIHFGKQAGLDIEKVIEVISKGAAGSWQMENRHKTMNAGKYDFGFAVDWMRKDLGICLAEADRNGASLPVTALVDQFYKEVQAHRRQALGHLLAAGPPGAVDGRACDSASSTADEVLAHLRGLASEANREGMKRYGIKVDRVLGISHGVQRDIGKTIRRDHARAFELWASGITEAQFIASITADPKRFTARTRAPGRPSSIPGTSSTASRTSSSTVTPGAT